MQITTTSSVSPTSRTASVNQELSNKQAEPPTQRLLAQVLNTNQEGVTQLKTLPAGQTLQLQTASRLTPGQLVIVELSAGQVRLDSQSQQVAAQLLRQLLPLSGSLKTALLAAVATALSAQTALSSTTTLNAAAAAGTASNLGQTIANHQSLLAGGATLPAGLRPPSQGVSTATQPIIPGDLAQLLQKNGTGKLASHDLLQQLASTVSPGSGKAATELTQQLSQILKQLPDSATLRDSGQIANLLAPGASQNALIKLLLPLLKSVLQTPINKPVDQDQLPKLSQLLARAMLSAIRAPGSGQEAEVGRGEWLSRFEHNLDSFQFELGIVRERYEDAKQRSGDGTKTDNKVRQWTVRLAFDFEELGLITAFVVLTNNRQLEMNFWTECTDTRIQIEQFKQRFQSRLDLALSPHGIEQLEIGVHEGEPPPSKPQVTTQLVSEVA